MSCLIRPRMGSSCPVTEQPTGQEMFPYPSSGCSSANLVDWKTIRQRPAVLKAARDRSDRYTCGGRPRKSSNLDLINHVPVSYCSVEASAHTHTPKTQRVKQRSKAQPHLTRLGPAPYLWADNFYHPFRLFFWCVLHYVRPCSVMSLTYPWGRLEKFVLPTIS